MARGLAFPLPPLPHVCATVCACRSTGAEKTHWRSAYESLIKQSHKHHHLMLRYSYLIHAVWWAVRVAHMRRWQERGNADSLSLSLSLSPLEDATCWTAACMHAATYAHTTGTAHLAERVGGGLGFG